MNKNGLRLLLLAVIVICAALAIFFLPVKDWILRGLEWTEGLGLWAAFFIAAFYLISCVFFIPGSIVTLGAGFILKVVVGTITVSIGSTVGACLAFWIGRTVGRQWISGKIAGNERFSAIDKAVGREGFKIVLLTRLSPIFPFNLQNYMYGLTRVKFRHYALASWIGMVPGTIMYVYFGASLRSLTEAATGEVETGAAGQVFFWIGLLVAIAVTIFVTRVAKKALNEIQGDENE
jgi:uncharacterized membrane protein YdjX (TVP38/TMEM64 family)